MNRREIEKLVGDFRGAAVEKGDFALGKRDAQLHRVMRDTFHELKKLGAAGNESLEALLEDESPYVRVWVASALLVEGNARARQVLETMAGGNRGVIRLDAQMVLEEFDKGTLKTPFP